MQPLFSVRWKSVSWKVLLYIVLCQKTMRLVSSPFLYWIRLICAIIYCKINKTYWQRKNNRIYHHVRQSKWIRCQPLHEAVGWNATGIIWSTNTFVIPFAKLWVKCIKLSLKKMTTIFVKNILTSKVVNANIKPWNDKKTCQNKQQKEGLNCHC